MDKGLPVFFGNLLQCHHLSKTIEWIFRVAEYVHHHVAFASIETVRRAVLSLPDRTHGSLQSLPVGQVCQLLELVNADNDMDAFCLGYFSGRLSISSALSFKGLKLRFASTAFTGSLLMVRLGDMVWMNFTMSAHLSPLWKRHPGGQRLQTCCRILPLRKS